MTTINEFTADEYRAMSAAELWALPKDQQREAAAVFRAEQEQGRWRRELPPEARRLKPINQRKRSK